MKDKIRFGYELPLNNPKKIIKLAIEANDAGFDSIWMPDHLIGIGDPSCVDPWCLLSILSVHDKIQTRLGVAVTDPHRRHPASLAQTISTIDNLSNGRINLGLGTGAPMNLDRYGFNSEKPVSKLKEFIEMLRELWKGNLINREGKFFKFKNAIIKPTPKQDNISIWIAANNPMTLRLTAQIGDGWLPVRLSPELMAEYRKIIQTELKNNNRKPEDIIFGYFLFVAIGKNKEQVLEKIRLPAKVIILQSPEIIEKLGYNIPKLDFSQAKFVPDSKNYPKLIKEAKKIPDEILDDLFAFGSLDDVIDKIEGFIKIGGCRYFILCPEIMPNSRSFLKLFSNEILPIFYK
jgi:alkanesulfonate monooxygenase SsuD/methylene tetrahydromethanopterin reductase-like flavin-dependent oxidoreductase (luciferase family)